MKTKLLFFSFIFIHFFSVSQTTIAGGSVSGNWTLAGSPYLVKGSILIPKDSTLKIQAGVKINFLGHYKLMVQGRLLANGTSANNIIFTTDSASWYGIRFDNTPATSDSSKLSYCLIEKGEANNGTGSDQLGGGLLFNNFSKVDVNHCTLTKNSNYQIYCINSSPKISYSLITYSSFGGGVWLVDHSHPIFDHDEISYNKGGGIYADQNNADSLIVLNTTVSHNQGVGLTCIASTYRIQNSFITDNNASLTNGPGGIYCNHSTGIISNTLFLNNSGTSGYAGGIFCYFCGGTISRNVISNNSSENGAGIFCIGTDVLISNNVIVNNTASGSGGGIFCVDKANPTIINNTIANNEAAKGGGLYCAVSSNPSIENTIFYGNTASSSGAQVYLNDENCDPSINFCNVQGGSAAFGVNGNFYTGTYTHNIDFDPQFVAPTTGSGKLFNGSTANWTLKSSSSCINKGNPVGTYPSIDKAGNPRVYNSVIDMGAYELQTVGIPDHSYAATVSISPNPFSSYTIIRTESPLKDATLAIFNLYGQLIKFTDFDSGSPFLLYKNDLPAGVYFMQLISKNKTLANEKLVITD